MGRIKTTPIKRRTLALFKKYHDSFGNEFADNKKHVDVFVETHSKKVRNVIAGYITRLTRKSSKG